MQQSFLYKLYNCAYYSQKYYERTPRLQKSQGKGGRTDYYFIIKEYFMKLFIESAAVLLLATVLMAALPTEAEGRIYEDTVRLHIPANSDSEEDQAVKICIRDRLLSTYGAMLSGYESKEAATAALESLLPRIESDVCAWLAAEGCAYGARVRLCTEWYGRRVYADAVYPEGEYLSLQIILGAGEGKNWWCVMYPPLCLDMALGEALPYSEEERALIGGKYKVKLKALEIASGLCRARGG